MMLNQLKSVSIHKFIFHEVSSPRFREVTSHEMCHQLVHRIIEGPQFFHI